MKRLFDIILSAFGLVLLAPLGLLISILVKLWDGGPVFFGQERVGQFGRPFRIWKFRSMRVDAERQGLSVTRDGDPRITRIGGFLRKTKLDEIPQLWNVLKGDMSFVGPRPEVPCYVERYTTAQREMLQHRPGITDMASVQFRNEQALLAGAQDANDFYIRYCLPRKIALNLQYARQASLPYDIWIILQTLCPYWAGVLSLYAVLLLASFWFSFELRYDFHMPEADRADFWTCLPWMVPPQLFLLFLRKQCRGLVSYFSFIELLQIGFALGVAGLLHLGLRYSSGGVLAPPPGIIVTDFILSVWGITWARLFLKFMRESQSAKLPGAKTRPHRVAIIGSGELGTQLALDLLSRELPTDVVAFFDDDPRSWNRRPYDIPVVGMPECLLNSEWRDKVDEVIVALPDEDKVRLKEIAELMKKGCLPVAFASQWQAQRPAPVA